MTIKYSILDKIVWTVILVCIFIRPFISSSVFTYLNFVTINIFIIASFLYLRSKNIKFTATDIAVMAFLTVIFISALTTADKTNNINELYNYIALITLFYIVRSTNEKDKEKILSAIIISAIFVSLYSLRALFVVSNYTLKYLSTHNISYPFTEEFIKRKRAFSPFISPNLLAGYLVMIIILCAGIISQRIKDKKNWYATILAGLCAVVSSVTLFFTKSIGGWSVLTVCTFLFFIFIKKLNKKSIVILFSLALILSAIFIIRNQEQEYFTKPIFSAYKRLNYWRETLHIITLHPLKGTGLGNFSLKESRTAHNSYLQIWAEMGMPAIVIWLIIVFLFIKTGINNISYNGKLYYNTALLVAGLSFIIHNVIDFSFFVAQSSFLWWIILALTASNTD